MHALPLADLHAALPAVIDNSDASLPPFTDYIAGALDSAFLPPDGASSSSSGEAEVELVNEWRTGTGEASLSAWVERWRQDMLE